MDTTEQAQEAIIIASNKACIKINNFSKEVLHTRGGRIGSGMGTLLEALWGYFTNHELNSILSKTLNCELAWMYGHEYNDFACVMKDSQWNPNTRSGELLRIEVKSMVASADESKAHFDQIKSAIAPNDLLAVFVWDWKKVDDYRVCPQIIDHFVGPAIPIALIRDELHLKRGGTFVDSFKCPDGCLQSVCLHEGEPLNENGKRERITGPESCRVSKTVSYAANFGGMVRMLKTNSNPARDMFRELRRKNDVIHNYISFIHRNFPDEEYNQYTTEEWKKLASLLGINNVSQKKIDLVTLIRDTYPYYQDQLRDFSTHIIPKIGSDETKVRNKTFTPRLESFLENPHKTPVQLQLTFGEGPDDGLRKLLETLQSRTERSKEEEES